MNPEGASNCEACFTALPKMTSCPTCQASVPEDAFFCSQCGAAMPGGGTSHSANPEVAPTYVVHPSLGENAPGLANPGFEYPSGLPPTNVVTPNVPSSNLPPTNVVAPGGVPSGGPEIPPPIPAYPSIGSELPPTNVVSPLSGPEGALPPTYVAPPSDPGVAATPSGVAPTEFSGVDWSASSPELPAPPNLLEEFGHTEPPLIPPTIPPQPVESYDWHSSPPPIPANQPNPNQWGTPPEAFVSDPFTPAEPSASPQAFAPEPFASPELFPVQSFPDQELATPPLAPPEPVTPESMTPQAFMPESAPLPIPEPAPPAWPGVEESQASTEASGWENEGLPAIELTPLNTPEVPTPMATAPPPPAPETTPLPAAAPPPQGVSGPERTIFQAPAGVAGAGMTVIQRPTARLLHVRTNTSLELPSHLTLIHVGKPNDRTPPDVDVSGFADSEVVSRVHANIRVEADGYYVEDLGSANGTYINNTSLRPGDRYRLRPGDRVSLGREDKVSFIFQTG